MNGWEALFLIPLAIGGFAGLFFALAWLMYLGGKK